MSYKELIKKYQKDLLNDLKNLVAIDSTLVKYDPQNTEFPFGKGPRQALDLISQIASRDGFVNKNYANHAVELNYGTQKPFIIIAGHVDVVPVGKGWKTNPFQLVYDKKSDYLFGRGTLDDKGPALAAYYALKIIKEQNIPLKRRVKMVFGCDEETGSRCIKKYNELVTEKPDYGFIPDAEFPLIFSEKGILRLDISLVDNEILNAQATNIYNMVPEDAMIEFIDHCQKKATGKAAHGSLPHLGENAILKLVAMLDADGIQTDLTYLLTNYFMRDNTGTADTKGTKLGIATSNSETGDLSLNLGVLCFAQGEVTLGLDIRYPNNTSSEEIVSKIKATLAKAKVRTKVKVKANSKPLYFAPQSTLVTTLERVYRQTTGDTKSPLLAIGGGTYAREFNNAIAFGAEFPNRPSLMHAPNEGYLLKDLLLAVQIYIEAIVALANL